MPDLINQISIDDHQGVNECDCQKPKSYKMVIKAYPVISRNVIKLTISQNGLSKFRESPVTISVLIAVLNKSGLTVKPSDGMIQTGTLNILEAI